MTANEEAHDINTMKLDELMGSLQNFELNLKQNKKEKSITLRVEEQESNDEGNTNDDEFLVLLIKKFKMFLNKMNKEKNSHNSKKPISTIESMKKKYKGL